MSTTLTIATWAFCVFGVALNVAAAVNGYQTRRQLRAEEAAMLKAREELVLAAKTKRQARSLSAESIP